MIRTKYNTRYNICTPIKYSMVERDENGALQEVETVCLSSFDFPEYEIRANDSDFIVTSEYENRLDKISHHFYGTPMYWWIIAMYNNIYNPLQIRAGMRLIIPHFDNIAGIIGEYNGR